LKDGTRKVTAITEVAGMEGDTIVLSDIFKYQQTAIRTDGTVEGELRATGLRLLFSPRLEAAGIKLGPEIFSVTAAELQQASR
jgi:pilus assembly protein CpaF